MSNAETDTGKKPVVACITVGLLAENCYLYACPETREAVIIDPGAEADKIIAQIKNLELIPKYIINTHGHFDHICAVDAVSEAYPVPLAIHADDIEMYSMEQTRDAQLVAAYAMKQPLVKRKPDIILQEGDRITFGTLALKVLHTPGHTPGGISLVSEPYCVFSGDTLFHRGIGRTDLPGGNYAQIEQAIRNKLYTLDEELVVFPGHGQPTTIIEEKYENPFVTSEE